MDKGVLIESDVAEIQTAIDAQYQPIEEITEEENSTILTEQEVQTENNIEE